MGINNGLTTSARHSDLRKTQLFFIFEHSITTLVLYSLKYEVYLNNIYKFSSYVTQSTNHLWQEHQSDKRNIIRVYSESRQKHINTYYE